MKNAAYRHAAAQWWDYLCGMELIDRFAERGLLDSVLHDVRSGQSRVLVLHGDPGVGKSALMDYVARQAGGCRVVRAAGVESEMELAYAALHQLCIPLLDRLDHLPAPQRDALSIAFGMSAGQPPDRLVIGLAVVEPVFRCRCGSAAGLLDR